MSSIDTKYQKRCLVLLNLLCNEYRNIEFKMELNEENNLFEITLFGKIITLLPDIEYKIVSKLVKDKSSLVLDLDCSLCCNKINKRVTCPNCTGYYCVNCYIDIFKSNMGLIKCPYCRHCIGNKLNSIQLEKAIEEIKRRTG